MLADTAQALLPRDVGFMGRCGGQGAEPSARRDQQRPFDKFTAVHAWLLQLHNSQRREPR